MNNYILAFSSTHKVLKAESLLKEALIAFRLDPAPSNFTDYCELVITIGGEFLYKAIETFEANIVGLEKALKKTKDADEQDDLRDEILELKRDITNTWEKVRKAKEVGLATPRLETFFQLIRGMEFNLGITSFEKD